MVPATAERMFKVVNPGNEPFRYYYNNAEYTVPAGKKGLLVPESIARHLAFHAGQRRGQPELVLTEVQARYDTEESETKRYRDPQNGKEYDTLEELLAAARREALGQGRK